MRQENRGKWAAVAGLVLALAAAASFAAAQGKVVSTRGTARAVSAATSDVVLAWGVGGVLTSDGTLWQYRPEKRRWMTIDESFSLDGERRKLLPLPVPVRDIATMQGFGFLVTRRGAAWLYNLDQNRWENIGGPGR